MIKSVTFRITALQAKQQLRHLFISDFMDLHCENTVHLTGLWAVVISLPQPVLFKSWFPFSFSVPQDFSRNVLHQTLVNPHAYACTCYASIKGFL